MFKRVALLLMVALVAVVCLYVAVVFEWSYSSGERAGWLQKFSRKGWICKTWEGELAMVPVPGATPEKFYFTVRDDAVAAQLSPSVGQHVRLHYEQHRGLPGTCFGETGYWVNSATLVKPQPGFEAPLAPPAFAPSAPPAAPSP